MPKRAKICLEDNVTPLSLNNLNLEDVILGDRSNNEMTGTDANDIFLSSRGSDIMKGGDGIDIVDYSAHRGAITIGPAGAIDKGRGESDLIRDIEVIVGAEDRPNRIDVSSVGEASSAYLDVDLSTGELSAKDIPFIGNLSFSIEHFQHVTGSGNADIIIGNDQNNQLDGGAGDDIIDGGLGRNNIKGGEGADTFIYSGGVDRIHDFNPDEGDVIKLGAEYSDVQQTNRGTLLSFEDGGQLMLCGISATDLQTDWFFG